jgi:23S rRNA pseudouridine1911/1915/1917 synthase
VKAGQTIANRTDFTVLDETDDYIVVNKPAPLLVHPSKPSPVRTLWHELNDLLVYEVHTGGQLSIINRLDRETSGVVLVAKHYEAARSFSLLMQERQFTKSYFAKVWGWPSDDTFSIEAPLLRQGEVQPSTIWLKRMVHPDGQASETRVTVLRRFEFAGQRFSDLSLQPITGRMHQLRVHLSHVKLPIVGDKIYGPDERCYLEFIKHGWTDSLAETLILPRHALHASALGLRSLNQHWRAPMAKDLNWPN